MRSATQAAGSAERGMAAKDTMYTPITRPWYAAGVWCMSRVLLTEV
jgi:hypothetical protein